LKVNESKVSLSIVIPAYNIENAIPIIIENISKLLDSTDLLYEIIVVNDGSIDKTLNVLQEISKNKSNLNFISYKQNKGKGFAIRTGIKESRGKWVMFIDGDLDISTEVIPEYINQLKNFDLIIASKVHHLSKTDTSFSRTFLSKAFSILVRFCTGIKIKDTQVGLKAGNGEILRNIFSIMHVDGYAFDVELLTIASVLNLTIKEMPIRMQINRRFRFLSSVQMFYDVLLISYRKRIKRYYQKK